MKASLSCAPFRYMLTFHTVSLSSFLHPKLGIALWLSCLISSPHHFNLFLCFYTVYLAVKGVLVPPLIPFPLFPPLLLLFCYVGKSHGFREVVHHKALSMGGSVGVSLAALLSNSTVVAFQMVPMLQCLKQDCICTYLQKNVLLNKVQHKNGSCKNL